MRDPRPSRSAARSISGCGLGLRREHHDVVLRERPAVPWFEVISENFMAPGGRPRHLLEQVRRDYPIALHGVSLSVGSKAPASDEHIAALKRLVDWIEPAIVSDHLCWTGLGGHTSHDLLPLPFTEEAVAATAARIRYVQEILGRRILVENISTYLEFDGTSMAEHEFVAAVADAADCGILLDVNNVYVNARNHGTDPHVFLDGVPADRVGQIHLAGHEDRGDVVIDTHDHPIREEVFALFRRAVERFGAVPTLIERDADVPELPALMDEMRVAQSILDGADRRASVA